MKRLGLERWEQRGARRADEWGGEATAAFTVSKVSWWGKGALLPQPSFLSDFLAFSKSFLALESSPFS